MINKCVRAGLTAWMLAAGVAASAQTVFTASSWVPPTHALSMAQKEWCDLLASQTGGHILHRARIHTRAFPVYPDGGVRIPGRQGRADLGRL